MTIPGIKRQKHSGNPKVEASVKSNETFQSKYFTHHFYLSKQLDKDELYDFIVFPLVMDMIKGSRS